MGVLTDGRGFKSPPPKGVILLAVAKARAWIDDLASGHTRSFDEIAAREGKVERHIRLLTPLAFIPPRTLAAIIDGTGPHDATVTALAQAVPYRRRAIVRRWPLMIGLGP